MKKQLCLLLCGVALMGVLTACGEEKISTKDVSLSDISGTLESYSKGSYTSQTIGDLKTEYDIDSGDVKQFSARIKNGTCIVMVEAISDDAANRIEGKLSSGDKVVVVEDLISTGGSVIDVVEALRDAGAEVLGVVSIFTYGMQKGLDRLRDAKVENHSLTDFDTVAQVAAETGYVKPEDVARLIAFRNNPSDESWIGK